jgi:hypothetical protein
VECEHEKQQRRRQTRRRSRRRPRRRAPAVVAPPLPRAHSRCGCRLSARSAHRNDASAAHNAPMHTRPCFSLCIFFYETSLCEFTAATVQRPVPDFRSPQKSAPYRIGGGGGNQEGLRRRDSEKNTRNLYPRPRGMERSEEERRLTENREVCPSPQPSCQSCDLFWAGPGNKASALAQSELGKF